MSGAFVSTNGFRMVANASAPPTASPAAAIHIACWNPVEKSATLEYEALVMPAATGRTANAISCAVLATPLFTADDTPAYPAGLAARTVAVRGATVADARSAMTLTPGRQLATYVDL